MTLRRVSWKVPARFAPVAFAFFMSVLVAFLISLAVTAVNHGLRDGYLLRVLSSYAASSIVSASATPDRIFRPSAATARQAQVRSVSCLTLTRKLWPCAFMVN